MHVNHTFGICEVINCFYKMREEKTKSEIAGVVRTFNIPVLSWVCRFMDYIV